MPERVDSQRQVADDVLLSEPPLAPVDLHDPLSFDRGVPHDAFAAMRATPGLTWTPPTARTSGFWSVTRADDLIAVSRDHETYSSEVGHIQIYDIDDDARAARASMIDLDPPVHTRLRRLVSSAFTPRRVLGYRRDIRDRVCAALDRLIAGDSRDGVGVADWVDLVAKPIPIAVICDLMGVPPDDHDHMIELSDHLVAGTGREPLEPTAYGNTTDLRLLPFNSPAAWAMSVYAEDLGRRRLDEPADDLISDLVRAEIDGQRLTADEFANFFRLMIFAGNETTRSAIAHLALHRHRFPEAFERVADDRSLLDGLVEEVIRYSSPILYFRRTVTSATTLSGTDLAVGDKVVMWYAAANFDETVFADPLGFRPDRAEVPSHVAFGGGGAHFCLGAALARLELTELIDEMLDRRLEFSAVSDPVYVESNFVNGIDELIVEL